MDGWKDLIGVKGQNRDEDVTSLRHVTGTDNVHFTREGYENLAAAIHATINTRRCVSAALSNVAGTNAAGKKQQFFWRGFVSPTGSTRPKFTATSYNSSKRGRMHPYRGRGRRN